MSWLPSVIGPNSPMSTQKPAWTATETFEFHRAIFCASVVPPLLSYICASYIMPSPDMLPAVFVSVIEFAEIPVMSHAQPRPPITMTFLAPVSRMVLTRAWNPGV